MIRTSQRIALAAGLLIGLAALPGWSADTAPAPAPAAAVAGAPAAGDAAARHAKRTACIKDARTKKLVGADKTAFIKKCIAAP